MVTRFPLVVVDAIDRPEVKYISWAAKPVFRPMLNPWLNLEIFDPHCSYHHATWFVLPAHSYEKRQAEFESRNVIIDVCLEANMPKWDRIGKNKPANHIVMYGSVGNNTRDTIYVPNFFWYNEALSEPKLAVVDRTYKKKFLMPIGRKTQWRDYVVAKLEPYLDQAYWSYIRRGRALPWEPEDLPNVKRYNSRAENARWYADTGFSLVLESITDWNSKVIFVTEKILKPIKNQHPFVAIAAAGFLQHLRTQGFETFDNLFDERYDLTEDLDSKLECVIENIERFECVPYDKHTVQKLTHNHDLFFNRHKIQQGLEHELIGPLLDRIS